MKKKPTPKQTELFDLSSIPVLTKEQFKESLKQEFIQSKAPAIVPQKPLRGDRFIYYRENERPLQLAMDSGSFKPYPKWAFPPIGSETEVIQLLYSSNRIGIDFEFYPGTLRPSIIGVASPTQAAACRWKGEIGAVTKALHDAVSRGAKFVGHFVLGADKLVLEKALGIETPHTQWDDSMIRHYLCYAALTKSPGKTESEGALGFMNLGSAAHLWLGIANWKNCRGNHCTGPCPKCSVFNYCAVDAWAGLRISDLAIIDMERKGIPERVYTEHAEIAWEFCLTSEKHGIKVDVENLEKVDKEIETKKEALFPKDEGGNYSKFNPKSNIQVVEYFNKNGVKLKDNRKQTILDLCTIIADDYGYETLKDFIEVPPENRPEISPIEQDLMDLFMFKDSGKGVDPWFGSKYLRNGFIHPRFNFTGASTMRFSSSGPNYQNIGAHGWGAALKRLIIPRSKKYKLLSADAANLELRTVLHESGIDVGHVGDAFKWLVEQSSGAFKSPAEELGKTERDLAKIASHASNYLLGLALLTKDQLMESRTKSAIAQGALVVFEDWIYHGFIVGFTGSKLAQMLYKDKTYASRKKVLEIQKIYFDNFPSIREWHRKILRQAELGFVQTCWGDYLELIDEPHKNAKVAAAKIGQGLGAVYVQGKMLEYLRKYPNFKSEVNMIGQVHDEIIWEIPYDWDDLTIVQFCDILYKESHRIPGFKCPWSIKVGDNWGTMRKLNREEILKNDS